MNLRILVLFIAGFSSLNESQGTNYCSSNTPVVNVCDDNSANSTASGVYVNSGSSPISQVTECTCIITPVTTRHISLKLHTNRISEDAANFEFNIQNLTINNSISALNISKETKLVYTSSDNSTGGTCIWIGPVSDKDMFTVTCFRQIHSTTGVTEPSTGKSVLSTSSDRTRSTDDTQPTNGVHMNTKEVTTTSVDHQKDTTTKDKTKTSKSESKHHDTNWTLLAVIIGSTLGTAVIVLTITGIVCYKRYKREVNGPDNTVRRDVADYCDMQINLPFEHLYDGLQMSSTENEHNSPI